MIFTDNVLNNLDQLEIFQNLDKNNIGMEYSLQIYDSHRELKKFLIEERRTVNLFDICKRNFDELSNYDYNNFNSSFFKNKYEKKLSQMEEYLNLENPRTEATERFYTWIKECYDIYKQYKELNN